MGLFGEGYGLLPIQSRIDDTHKMPIHPLIVIVALLNADGDYERLGFEEIIEFKEEGSE